MRGQYNMTSIHVHRGAGDLAIENTLAAYEAAILAGADGLEVDIRRCSDGTLVMFHDEWTDRRLETFGQLSEYSYPELLLCRFRRPFGLTRETERIATFEEFLLLAKQFQTEIHIDLKEAAGDSEVLAKIRESGLMNLVTRVNQGGAPAVFAATSNQHHPGPFASILFGANDFDSAAVTETLNEAGTNGVLLLDDPRCALALLDRLKPEPYQLSFSPPSPEFAAWPVDKGLPMDRPRLAKQIWSHPAGFATRLMRQRDRFAPVPENLLWALARLAERGQSLLEEVSTLTLAWLREGDRIEIFEAAADLSGRLKLAAATESLLSLLHSLSPVTEFTDDPLAIPEIRKTIRCRAVIARALGQIGDRSPETLVALKDAAMNRSLSLENGYQGLDGTEAVKALAKIDLTGSLVCFRKIVLTSDPALVPVKDNKSVISWLKKYPDWWDFRIRVETIRAVGDSPSAQARQWLFEMLSTGAETGEKLWDEFHWEVARGITSGVSKLEPGQIRQLFAHSDRSVRREAANYLLKTRHSDDLKLMEEYLPWFPINSR